VFCVFAFVSRGRCELNVVSIGPNRKLAVRTDLLYRTLINTAQLTQCDRSSSFGIDTTNISIEFQNLRIRFYKVLMSTKLVHVA